MSYSMIPALEWVLQGYECAPLQDLYIKALYRGERRIGVIVSRNDEKAGFLKPSPLQLTKDTIANHEKGSFRNLNTPIGILYILNNLRCR